MVNKQYSEAISWDVPMDVLALIKRNFDDEKRHLEYIESAINDRIWEKKAA